MSLLDKDFRELLAEAVIVNTSPKSMSSDAFDTDIHTILYIDVPYYLQHLNYLYHEHEAELRKFSDISNASRSTEKKLANKKLCQTRERLDVLHNLIKLCISEILPEESKGFEEYEILEISGAWKLVGIN